MTAKLLFLLAVFLPAFCCKESQPQDFLIDPDIRLKIDAFIETLMKKKHIPAFGLGITSENGSKVYVKGYGFSNLEEQIPATPSTLFSIGSISKSFTALVVVKTLARRWPSEGAGILDKPIRELAPAYNFTLIDRYRSERTSFKDLLSHRVCTRPEGLGEYMMAFPDAAEFLFRLRYAPEVCGFRNGYVYNNGLINLAADILGHMGNTTYQAMLRNLLDEIGMTETTWVKMTDDHNSMPGRSVPYIWKDGKFVRLNPELLNDFERRIDATGTAAGGILSTPSDMVKYLNFHLNLGKVGDRQVIPQDVMKWLYGIYNPFPMPSVQGKVQDITLGYGLGLKIGFFDGWVRIGHGGYVPPYESLISFYPGLKLGIFTTISGPGFLMHRNSSMEFIHNQVYNYIQRLNKSSNFEVQEKGQKPIDVKAVNSSKLKSGAQEIKILEDKAVGTYGNGLNGEMTISLRNESGQNLLYWKYGVWGKGWLNQISNATFIINWDSDFWQIGWTYNEGMPNSTLYFLDENTIRFMEGGEVLGDKFIRGLKIDDLPVVPWEPDSC